MLEPHTQIIRKGKRLGWLGKAEEGRLAALTQSLGAEWAGMGSPSMRWRPGPTETEGVLVWKTPATIA